MPNLEHYKEAYETLAEQMKNVTSVERADRFGITAVFAAHLDLSLSHMHPAQAFEAAQHAARAYLASHDFVEVGTKEDGTPEYRMMALRPEKR